ncbi:hypothetical protein J6590_020469 [Homalodisca vitripennis]|nr:hypothetical protein J6590_020469 [Homalodisca vitripennis]
MNGWSRGSVLGVCWCGAGIVCEECESPTSICYFVNNGNVKQRLIEANTGKWREIARIRMEASNERLDGGAAIKRLFAHSHPNLPISEHPAYSLVHDSRPRWLTSLFCRVGQLAHADTCGLTVLLFKTDLACTENYLVDIEFRYQHPFKCCSVSTVIPYPAPCQKKPVSPDSGSQAGTVDLLSTPLENPLADIGIISLTVSELLLLGVIGTCFGALGIASSRGALCEMDEC